MTFSVMPDIEAVALKKLNDAGVCSGRCYPSIPASPTYPLAVVERIGGIPPVRQRLDNGNVQVRVYGNSKAEARDAAELARRKLMDLENTTDATNAAWVSGVADTLGLSWQPDPVSKRDCYVFGVAIFAHANP